MFEDLHGSGLLIHHWDTDGICSARLLLERLSEKVVNTTPELGNYFLTEQELTRYSSYDFIIIADMALPKEHVLRLAQHAKVLIFDHHLQPLIPGVIHQNPVSAGEPPESFPSASWVVNEYLKNPLNVYALLGVVGDHEQRIQANKRFYGLISETCTQEHLTFEDLVHMVYLLDSSYKIGDRKSVIEAPHLLLEYADVGRILQNLRWQDNLAMLDREVSKWVEAQGEERQGVLLKRIHTKCNIISTVTRKIFWSTGSDTVVVNTGFFAENDQVYVRSKKDLKPLIELGKSLGFRCGGKAEVCGAVVPKEKTELFVQEVFRFLSNSSTR